VAAGSSDWVVLAGPDGSYPDDEAYFVGAILQTIEDALDGPDTPPGLAGWLADRRRQLAGGELVYLAHQLDVAGRSPGRPADEPVPVPGEPSGPRSRAPG
jgi:hypothetical protein